MVERGRAGDHVQAVCGRLQDPGHTSTRRSSGGHLRAPVGTLDAKRHPAGVSNRSHGGSRFPLRRRPGRDRPPPAGMTRRGSRFGRRCCIRYRGGDNAIVRGTTPATEQSSMVREGCPRRAPVGVPSVALHATTIRFADRAYTAIARAADAQGISVSQYVREAALIRAVLDEVDSAEEAIHTSRRSPARSAGSPRSTRPAGGGNAGRRSSAPRRSTGARRGRRAEARPDEHDGARAAAHCDRATAPVPAAHGAAARQRRLGRRASHRRPPMLVASHPRPRARLASDTGTAAEITIRRVITRPTGAASRQSGKSLLLSRGAAAGGFPRLRAVLRRVGRASP